MMMDVSVWGAFVGGLIVFFSPCVLPIVPFYISYMAGASMAEMNADGGLPPGLRVRAFLASIMFALGMITVFVLIGATAFAVSKSFGANLQWFRYLAALLVGLMGLHFLGVMNIPFLNRSFQMELGNTKKMSVLGAYVVGFAFMAGWTPCVGGVLTGVIMLASDEQTAWEGLRVMLVFGAGMTLPFVIASLFIGPFMAFLKKFRRHIPKVEKAMGLLLLVFAALIATNNVNGIANWMLSTFNLW